MTQPAEKITELIIAFSRGDQDALTRLVPLVYTELKAIARRHLKGPGLNQTLSPTALVHEAFERLNRKEKIPLQDRAHFFAVVGQCMRWVLLDRIKSKTTKKKGGEFAHVEFNEAFHFEETPNLDLVKLNAALEKLDKYDARLSRVVELRFLAGLTVDEVATILGTSQATVKRDWGLAKAWLLREMTESDE